MKPQNSGEAAGGIVTSVAAGGLQAGEKPFRPSAFQLFPSALGALRTGFRPNTVSEQTAPIVYFSVFETLC